MKLNKEQYIAAHHKDGPMLVLAGPGSGKTHLLVERITLMIEEYHIPPENILVITFSKKAARQMQARFEKRIEGNSYPVTFGTFHAVFYHILREVDPNINRLITDEEQSEFIKLAVKKCMLSSESLSDKDNTDRVIGMIGAYKNFGNDFYERSEAGRSLSEEERNEFGKLYAEYERLCRQEGVIDFDDMILLCGRMLYKHETILRKWQNRYRYFLVDEFQDINDGQYNVLRLLAGDKRNVFAVGDDDQSIYAFRGARPELMKKFLRQYMGCRQVTLTMNYRCCEQVIGAADTVIRHNTDRLQRPMQRHLPSKAGGIVEIVNSESTDVQAAYVCDKITELIAKHGYTPKDFAVLFRSRNDVLMFAKTAEERGIALRYEAGMVSKKRMIHEAYMRAHDNTATRADFFLIMNNPSRGLSREALNPDTGNYMEDLKRYYADDPKLLQKVFELENMIKNYPEWSKGRQGDGSFVLSGDSKSDDHLKTEEPSPCPVKTEEPPPCPGGEVNVMTAHASKGLEFSVVFIIGLQEGMFPHHLSMDECGIREERRLMYVAMTRAKERLYMCTVSREHGKRPSRFAAEACEKMRFINDIIKLTRC